MDMNKVARNLIMKGEHTLARKLRKVVAFDTRFNLFNSPEYKNQNIKHLYMLERPMFDKYYEAILDDGSKKLLNDEEVTQILKDERDYVESIRNNASEQLKKVHKFSKMGDLVIDPIQQAKEEALKKQEIQQQAEQVVDEDSDESEEEND